jgi:hypothetical protein
MIPSAETASAAVTIWVKTSPVVSVARGIVVVETDR